MWTRRASIEPDLRCHRSFFVSAGAVTIKEWYFNSIVLLLVWLGLNTNDLHGESMVGAGKTFALKSGLT